MSAIITTSSVRQRPIAVVTLIACCVLLGSCSDSSGTDDAGPPAGMQVLGGNGQEGTVGAELADALVVKVTDDRNRPVRNQLVNWRVTAGDGTVFAGSALTDPDGVARERWTLGTVAGAPQSVEARAVDNQSGQGIVFATFTATAKAGPATTLTASTTGTQEGTAGQALAAQIVVRASDQYDNPVAGQTITWDASGGGSAAPATSTTDAEGDARTTWTLGATAGTQQLTASSGSLEPATFAAVARAGGPARLEIVSGNQHDGTVGAPLGEGLVVRAVDALGNGVASVQVTWSVRSGGGTVSPATSTTNDAGIAQTAWTLGTTAGSQTAAASAAGVADAVFTAMARAGAPMTLEIAGGDAQQAPVGQTLGEAVAVRALDAYGNPTPGVGVSWRITGGDGTVAAASSVTDESGLASAQWTLGAVGDGHRLTAAVGVLEVTFRATATVAQGARLTAESVTPGSMVVRSTTSVQVRLVDGSGAPVPGVTVTWTGGGSGTPATSTTNASGESSITWRLGPTAGEQTLTAAVPNVEPVSFRTLATAAEVCDAGISSWSNDPAPVMRIGEMRSGISSFAFDWYRNPVAGWNAGSGSSGPDGPRLVGTLVTDETGRSGTASIQAGTRAGSQTLYFSGSICTSGSSDPDLYLKRIANYGVSIYVLPDPPSRLYASQSSDGQTGTAGTQLPRQLGIYVEDQYGNIVPNETITWAVVSGGGSVTPASNTTDSSLGSAWTTWTLGPAVGNQQVSATTSNGITYIFNATATAP